MKTLALKLRRAVFAYLKWGWPLVLIDAALVTWAGEPTALWRVAMNDLAFLWVLCAPVACMCLLLDRELRERAMARLCGLREGDERERVVTGEAARATLLLALSLQVVLLVLSLVSVHLVWDPLAPKGSKHGLLEVGMSFRSERHLDPFGAPPKSPDSSSAGRGAVEFGGYLLSPSAFPVLAVLILLQLAAFKGFALRRYEGADA
jgi:hypothetical protein